MGKKVNYYVRDAKNKDIVLMHARKMIGSHIKEVCCRELDSYKVCAHLDFNNVVGIFRNLKTWCPVCNKKIRLPIFGRNISPADKNGHFSSAMCQLHPYNVESVGSGMGNRFFEADCWKIERFETSDMFTEEQKNFMLTVCDSCFNSYFSDVYGPKKNDVEQMIFHPENLTYYSGDQVIDFEMDRQLFLAKGFFRMNEYYDKDEKNE